MQKQQVEQKGLAAVLEAIRLAKLPGDEDPYAVKVWQYKVEGDTVRVTLLRHGFIHITAYVRFDASQGFINFGEFNHVFTVRDLPQRFPVAGANKVGYDYGGIVMTAYNWGDALRAADALNKIRMAREQVIGMALEPKEQGAS